MSSDTEARQAGDIDNCRADTAVTVESTDHSYPASICAPLGCVEEDHSYSLGSPKSLKKKNQATEDILNKYKNKLKGQCQKSRRLKKKICTMKDAIKQLKKKDIQVRCLYPAQLKMKLNTGEKTFTTLMSAAAVLEELGVQVHRDERESIEEELRGGWRSSGRRKRNAELSASDLKAFLQGDT